MPIDWIVNEWTYGIDDPETFLTVPITNGEVWDFPLTVDPRNAPPGNPPTGVANPWSYPEVRDRLDVLRVKGAIYICMNRSGALPPTNFTTWQCLTARIRVTQSFPVETIATPYSPNTGVGLGSPGGYALELARDANESFLAEKRAVFSQFSDTFWTDNQTHRLMPFREMHFDLRRRRGALRRIESGHRLVVTIGCEQVGAVVNIPFAPPDGVCWNVALRFRTLVRY